MTCHGMGCCIVECLVLVTRSQLLRLLDVYQVYPVGSAMIRRTIDWILSRQHHHHKGFPRNQRTIDQFGAAPGDITE